MNGDANPEPWDFRIPTGSELRYMRERCDLTQPDVADSINTTQPSISAFENERRAPDAALLADLLLLYARKWPGRNDKQGLRFDHVAPNVEVWFDHD